MPLILKQIFMEKFLTPEYLLPIIAIVVSLLSLRHSYRYNRKTLILTEEHNRKSVQPVLSTTFTEAIEPKSTDFHGAIFRYNTYDITFELKNCGFGPAIIKSFQLTYDNINYSEIFALCNKYIGQSNYDDKLSLRHTFENEVIASNEHTLIFKIHFKEEKFFKEFHDIAKKIGLKIEFETIYEEENTFHLDSITN
jgi:hypothetical protein